VKSCTHCGAAFEGEGDVCPHCQREAAEAARWTPQAPKAEVTEALAAGASGGAVPTPAAAGEAPARAETRSADEAPERVGDAENDARDEGVSRRRFLTNTALTIGGVIGVGYTALALRYLFPNESAAATALQDVGALSQFPSMSPTLKTIVQDGVQDGVYVVNLSKGSTPTASQMLALDFHCTHLNCPVTWVPGVDGVGRYICPCHGSQFTINGTHVAGPAPRPMFRHELVVHNGRVLVGGIIS
jgi:Rieske Fe-S protein